MNKYRWILFAAGSLAGRVHADSVQADTFHVEFGTRTHSDCSFPGSPVDYCYSAFIESYQAALRTPPNFNQNMIVLAIDTRSRYAQQALVAINPSSRTVYPLPFDHFANSFSDSVPKRHGQVIHSRESDEICIDGEIMAYRSVQSGRLCWRLIGKQFSGEITPYTYPDH
jgi:hypothetical protein